MEKTLVALDTETKDELLKTKGWSWKYNQGYILCTSITYYNGETKVIAGLKNDNTPYDSETRRKQNAEVYHLLRNENVIILGANIQYDLGWLLYEYNMQTYDVKCSFIDILQAERILDEFTFHSLESLAQKYLKTGKTKDRCEEWVFANIPKARGDFRKYLSQVPYDLLCEYVKGDTELPLKIWEYQLQELSKQKLVERAKLEFDCILPILQITKNGFPFDNEQRKKNLAFLTRIRDSVAADFAAKLQKTGFNVNSSAHIAKLCDEQGIPYNCKITLKGKNGKKFANYRETDSACSEAKRYVNGFRFVKSIPVCYIDSKKADRAVKILEDAGFMLTCSPNVDKKFFASNREKYPLIAEIADWKACNSILSKILCDEYGENVCPDGKMRPQFNITDTISFRLSSQKPNCIARGMHVLTPNGYIAIEKLKVGDFVYNGNGNVTKVKNIWDMGVQSVLLTVSAKGDKIVTTEDHKFWTGEKWLEVRDCEKVECICRRTDSKNVSVYADEETNKRGSAHKNRYDYKSIVQEFRRARVFETENTAQNANSSCIYQPEGSIEFCERIFIRGKTALQGLMHKVQNIIRERKVLFKEVSNVRTKERAAQSACSASKVQEERNDRKTVPALQRGLFRHTRICNKRGKNSGRYIQENVHTQTCFCKSTRNRCGDASTGVTSSSHRRQPLKQRLGQLGALYYKSAQEITQTKKGKRKVFDIEVESPDHSFICENFIVSNCQQVVSKNGLKYNGREILFAPLTRALFKPNVGEVFWKIDYGQIEYRLICNIAVGEGSKEVREEYAKNPSLDFHQYVVDLTGLSRKYAKNMSFGVAFGMGLKSMAETFGWDMDRATEISEKYHEHMPFVAPTMAKISEVAKQRGFIYTALKSHARIPNKNKAYTALNRYTQGSAVEILKSAIVQAYKEGLWQTIGVVNTVHDELNGSVYPTEQRIRAVYRMAEIMRTCVELRIPLEASPELGFDWYHVKPVKEWLELKEQNVAEYEALPKELKKAIEYADLIERGII